MSISSFLLFIGLEEIIVEELLESGTPKLEYEFWAGYMTCVGFPFEDLDKLPNSFPSLGLLLPGLPGA